MNPQFRNLDLDALSKNLSTFTLSLNDYEMVSPTIARVILNTTGTPPREREELRLAIAKLFAGQASPVVDSFRSVTESCMAGHIKLAREVRDFDEAEVASGRLKALASNQLMDTSDQSLYEVKEGSTGKYMVRLGNDDLSQLVHLACKTTTGTPTLAHLASMPALVKEFAAYVDLDSEEVEHGYVVANTNGTMTVLPVGGEEGVEVVEAQLVEVINLDGEDQKVFAHEMAAEVASDTSAIIEYYRKAYPYAPDYVQKIIDIIGQHARA